MKSKTLILTGFSLVIILMALVIFISLTEFESSSKQLQTLVNVNNYKQKLVEEMYVSAFKRVSSLQRLVLLDDVFEQDDEAMFMEDQAGVFIKARRKLLKTALNKDENELLAHQGMYVKITVPMAREIAQLVHEEQQEKAQNLLKDKLIPAQLQVFNALEKLQIIQQKNIDQAFLSMLEAHKISRINMLGLGLAAALLSILIAFVTYQRVRFFEIQLSHEKERAQITLQNIVDGIITTDDLGNINYINPTAATLTEWGIGQAIGRPLLDVLNLVEALSDKACTSIESLKSSSNNDLILITRNKKTIAIEHSMSILPSSSTKHSSLVVVFRNVTEARELKQTLSYQATHDRLTGLNNRLVFEEHLTQLLSDTRNNDQTHVLCFLDLDHFKNVNDSAGHIAGDKLLVELTKLISKYIRHSDLLARIGGDEFAIILESCDIEKALQISEKIRLDVYEYNFIWQEKSFRVGVSIGITLFDAQAHNIIQILEEADKACYLAKSNGRNQVQVYDSAIAQRN